jgi:hypothetical protein
MIAIISATALAFTGIAGAAQAQSGQHTVATARTVAVWMQVMDSCKQALPGATFSVSGSGVNMTTAPTTGTGGPQMVKSGSNGNCPIQHGTCNFPTGCTVANLNVPSSGTAIYKIIPAKTAPGSPGSKNLRYAVCNGGSDCAHGPEVATVNVSSSGSVSATVLNPYPDGTTVTWPTDKQAYRGTQSDPILFHEFGIGDGSIQCDGDHDADDYLTGTPGAHCSSNLDGGRSRTGTKTRTSTKTKAPIH